MQVPQMRHGARQKEGSIMITKEILNQLKSYAYCRTCGNGLMDEACFKQKHKIVVLWRDIVKVLEGAD